MSACTFFGHRDCPGSVTPRLWAVLTELIVNCGVDTFYVGNQGGFDRIVRIILRELEEIYPHIHYAVVLAYLPGRPSDNTDFSDTILPEGIERIHPRFAISWRNRWMLRQSDYVVAYVIHDWGGAADCIKRAMHSGKTVINIGITEDSKAQITSPRNWFASLHIQFRGFVRNGFPPQRGERHCKIPYFWYNQKKRSGCF